MIQEQVSTGSMKNSVISGYLRALGVSHCTAIAFLLGSMQTAIIATDFWLARWTDHAADTTASVNLWFYIIVYGVLAGGTVLLLCLEQLFSARAGVAASTWLYQNMSSSLVKAPIWFFDITPLGRIINRISRDTDVIDNELPFTVHEFAYKVSRLLAICVLVCVVTIYMSVAIPPIMLLFFLVQLVCPSQFSLSQHPGP